MAIANRLIFLGIQYEFSLSLDKMFGGGGGGELDHTYCGAFMVSVILKCNLKCLVCSIEA